VEQDTKAGDVIYVTLYYQNAFTMKLVSLTCFMISQPISGEISHT